MCVCVLCVCVPIYSERKRERERGIFLSNNSAVLLWYVAMAKCRYRYVSYHSSYSDLVAVSDQNDNDDENSRGDRQPRVDDKRTELALSVEPSLSADRRTITGSVRYERHRRPYTGTNVVGFSECLLCATAQQQEPTLVNKNKTVKSGVHSQNRMWYWKSGRPITFDWVNH